MPEHIDSIIVGVYFVVVFIAGYFVSRYYKKASAGEFITGGRDRTWYQIAFALFAMAAAPAILAAESIAHESQPMPVPSFRPDQSRRKGDSPHA